MRKPLLFMMLVAMVLVASTTLAQTPPYNRTVIVQSTGVPTTDGAALLAAIAGLSPPPSSTNRWVIQLEGGIYSVGTTPIVLQPYISLNGAGVRTTIVRGNVQPPVGFLLGGLVQGASNSEIRDLTLHCLSTASVESCQAMSLDTANPFLTDLRILVTGTGTGNHWGIRTFDSAPVLDQVQIEVKPSGGNDTYGVVYGGSSTLNIKRSSIVARNGSNNNWALMLRESTNYSVLRDSTITAVGGNQSAGIRYLGLSSPGTLLIDNTEVTSYGASKSIGIGDNNDGSGNPRIFFRAGRLYGATHGFEHFGANVDFTNTEVYGTSVKITANILKVGSTWLRSSGIIAGATSATCAGTFNNVYAFFPSTCPP